MKINGDTLAKIVSLASALFLAFFVGGLFVYFKLFPHHSIKQFEEFVRGVIEHREAYFFGAPTDHLEPARGEPYGFTVAGDARAQPGLTLVVGLFGYTLGARLYDNSGELVHEWPVDFFKIAPETMLYEFHALIHGAWMYPNGDLLINLDRRHLYRIDACGRTVWVNANTPHHSIHVDDQGYIWTPTGVWSYNEPRLWREEAHVDRIAKFDPDNGKKLLEIDLVELLVEAEMQGIVLGVANKFDDLLHLNDVEVLSADMAAAFPLFDAGDIVLSFRNTNQLWVLDGRTHAIKWWQTGPWRGQHDPDFQPDGSITLFDNRNSVKPSIENDFLGTMGGSRILRLDPLSRETTTLFQSTEKVRFHSAFRGKHQVLANGNILITETDAGRAFEVTPGGDIVWSFVNGWDEDQVGWIMGAYKFPENYGAFAANRCQ